MDGNAYLNRARTRCAVLAAVLVGVTTCVVGLPSAAATPAARATAGPCGSLAAKYRAAQPPTYQHVVVLMEENLTYSSFQSLRARGTIPYTDALAKECGNERFMHAATHPSQPNYMAATGGRPTGVGVYSTANNVFHQAQSHGDSWRNYAEGIGVACGPKTSIYKPGHTPAYWYRDLRTPTNSCRRYDVPATQLNQDIANNRLPTYAWISPDECNDFYWVKACGGSRAGRFAKGDAYLRSLITRLVATPAYRNGSTVVFITWDEGDETIEHAIDCTTPVVYVLGDSCQIPTMVLSPYLVPGATDSADHNTYGLLATTEDILGYPRLGRAITQTTMRTGLGF